MNATRVMQVFVRLLVICTAQSLAQQAYYPLAEENIWQFGDPQHQTRATGDTLMPDGHTYRILLDTWYNLREFQRQQGDSVYVVGSLLYDFSRSPGDTIVQSPNGYVCILLSTGVSQVLGRPLRQWVFGRSWGSFSGEVDYVTDSLGLTAISNAEPPWMKVVSGATIDGVTYGLVSSMKAMIAAGIPDQIVLGQNYPNPFNPTTTIRYGLPNRSHVMLTVFNTLGQQVSLLQNGEQDAGYHDAKFDGSGLSTGVYFYRIQAGTYVETKKLILTK